MRLEVARRGSWAAEAWPVESNSRVGTKYRETVTPDDDMTPPAPRLPGTRSAATGRPSLDSAPILPDIARGDRAAVQRCMARYGALVWSLARRLSPSRADAEDATQEIFLDLWRSAGRFDATRGSEQLFVMMIARRRLIDRLRLMRQRQAHEVSDAAAMDADVPVDCRADNHVEAEIARAALEQLPAETQRVLDLSIVQGMSHGEIARRIGIPLGTVKTLVRRGLIKVRQALGGDGEWRE
jgi:RNA polymerase sigma-70 factor (ECF subfamily)